MRTKSNFPWKQFLPQLAALAIPVALQNLLSTTASMVDTMMIAPLGETSVGAVGLCAQFSSLMFNSYWGFIGGGVLFFSQYWGAKDHDGIDRAFGMVTACVMSLAAVAMFLAVAVPEFIMGVYTDKTSIQEISIKYLRAVGLAYPLQIFSVAMSTLLRSTEQVRIPLYASIVSVSTNIFLNWVFIYGNLGCPAMDVQGAALATTCAAAVNVLAIYVLSKIKGFPYLFHFRKHFKWTKEFVTEFFKRCYPIIIHEALYGVANMIINMVLGRQPEEAIAAIAVFRTLEGLVIGFFTGFANASAVLVGKCVGAGELDIAYERAKRITVLCGGFIFCVCLTLLGVRVPLLSAMGLSGESLRIGSGLILIYCVAAVIRMCNWVMTDTYRASGDATFGTILELSFLYAMVVPCVCVAGLLLHLPFFVVFIFCYIDEPIR
ncbi:MAG: MATE family efflux transporter, partial [Clostridia bacterium]|nr:MATE family efflux transporter [Clostridia bacterium]